jgi:hypothetical protein
MVDDMGTEDPNAGQFEESRFTGLSRQLLLVEQHNGGARGCAIGWTGPFGLWRCQRKIGPGLKEASLASNSKRRENNCYE